MILSKEFPLTVDCLCATSLTQCTDSLMLRRMKYSVTGSKETCHVVLSSSYCALKIL